MTVRTGQFQRVRDVGGGTVNHHCATRAKHWEHPVCIRIIHLDCSLPWEKRERLFKSGRNDISKQCVAAGFAASLDLFGQHVENHMDRRMHHKLDYV